MLAFLVACSGEQDTTPLSNLEQDVSCDTGPTVKGVDVSYYQGTIDWTAAHADGVEFAFIRVSDGTTFLDPSFATYWADSRTAGILHGAYQFFRPNEDPIAQADLLLSTMGPLKPDDLPPVIDVEATGNLSASGVAAAVKAWVDHVTQAIGRAPIIYTGFYFWRDSVGAPDMTTSPLWHAQYTTASCPTIAPPWNDWTFWQYTDAGTIAGITQGGVDVDRFNGSLADLQAFIGPAAPCGTIAAGGGMIDDTDPCFTAGGPQQYMRSVTSAGEGGELLWTHTTADATEANYGDWNLNFDQAGSYHLDVYTAAPYAQSKKAVYVVVANGVTTNVPLDQSAADGWQSLGDFDFAAGGDQSIHLADNTGEPSTDNVQLVFDAVNVTPSAMMGSDGSGSSGSDGSGSAGSDDGGGDDTMPAHHGGCSSGGGSGGALVLLALLALRSRARSR